MVVEWDLMGFHGNKPSGKRLHNELENHQNELENGS